MSRTVSFAVVGWNRTSRDVVRRLADLPDVKLRWLCDPPSELRLGPLAHRLGARRTSDPDVLFEDELVDAVVVCAAYADRVRLVRSALEADKDVLVLGPVAASCRETERLLGLARARSRILAAASPCVYEAAVCALGEHLAAGDLGELYYVDVDCSSSEPLSELAADDVAGVLHLLQDRPIEVEAATQSFSGEDTDVLTCSLRFASGVAAGLRYSRVEAVERHAVRVAGSLATAELDARQPEQRLVIHYRPERHGGHSVAVRLPRVDACGMLCDDFLTSVRARAMTGATGEMHAVAETVEAISQSLRKRGRASATVRLDGEIKRGSEGELSNARVALA